jgi:hypothetical protein
MMNCYRHTMTRDEDSISRVGRRAIGVCNPQVAQDRLYEHSACQVPPAPLSSFLSSCPPFLLFVTSHRMTFEAKRVAGIVLVEPAEEGYTFDLWGLKYAAELRARTPHYVGSTPWGTASLREANPKLLRSRQRRAAECPR